MGHFFQLSFGQSSCFAWSVFGISQGAPMCVHLSTRWILAKRPRGRLASLTVGKRPSPFLTSKEPFCACVVRKVSLTSRMRNVWSFISYLGQGPACSLAPAVTELLSTGNEFQLLTLGPISCLTLTARIQIRSLVRELRSCKPHDMVKKEKKKLRLFSRGAVTDNS